MLYLSNRPEARGTQMGGIWKDEEIRQKHINGGSRVLSKENINCCAQILLS